MEREVGFSREPCWGQWLMGKGQHAVMIGDAWEKIMKTRCRSLNGDLKFK